ncbi:unnamed protein product [Parascedosporium putredinis]|uniref:Uncharacterized protein n=1 Tax=Parascedosporium putredinis TaxID=1442378 RepID=A0A9P1H1K5_9PEZI|nr:unnamed protein product [Parascedosporium putredinis]CAI7993808.1 unnamed protein product [Parascedosporium putredinis]
MPSGDCGKRRERGQALVDTKENKEIPVRRLGHKSPRENRWLPSVPDVPEIMPQTCTTTSTATTPRNGSGHKNSSDLRSDRSRRREAGNNFANA